MLRMNHHVFYTRKNDAPWACVENATRGTHIHVYRRPLLYLSVRYRLDDLQDANGSPSEDRNHRWSRCGRAYLIFDGTLGGYDEIKVICERFYAV